MNVTKMSLREYQQHDDNSDGLCLHCGEIAYGMVEPDAEEYLCLSCDRQAVMGVMSAMVAGHIELVEEE